MSQNTSFSTRVGYLRRKKIERCPECGAPEVAIQGTVRGLSTAPSAGGPTGACLKCDHVGPLDRWPDEYRSLETLEAAYAAGEIDADEHEYLLENHPELDQ